jgi:tRNA modification GTPase
MLTIDISECWQTLGEITGETANEEIIGEIFSKFCVGK